MSAILLTAPALEPVSLAEAKAFLRVEHDGDDGVIAALTASARIHLERQTRRGFVNQAWRLVRDRWPDNGRIEVRPGPLRSLDAARIYDAGGIAHSLDTQAFVPDLSTVSLAFAPWSLAAPGRSAAGIELDVTVGYGDAASDVPESLRQAIRLLIAHWYDNRGQVSAGRSIAMLPTTVAALIAPYRMVAL